MKIFHYSANPALRYAIENDIPSIINATKEQGEVSGCSKKEIKQMVCVVLEIELNKLQRKHKELNYVIDEENGSAKITLDYAEIDIFHKVMKQ